MATINVNTNIAEVNARILAKLAKLKDKETLLRPLCFDLLELMKLRIHEKGLNAKGSAIGKYSNTYLKYRQRKHNRSADSKVIISLTRQLENDWSVIATSKGYGIGFKNPFNYQKSIWIEGGHEATTVKQHQRTVKTTEGDKKITVNSHTRKAWAGYGRIFSLTAEENQYASDFISHYTQQALGND